jgi:hypothetical protein
LLNIPRRVIKDAYERITTNDKSVSSALRRLAIEIQRKPKAAFDKWKAAIGEKKVANA